MCRGPAAAVLRLVRPRSSDDSLVLHQPLSGPLHHPHHLHQCDHHEPGALQPTTGEQHVTWHMTELGFLLHHLNDQCDDWCLTLSVSLSRWRRRWNTATTSSAPRLWWRPRWSWWRSASGASLKTGKHWDPPHSICGSFSVPWGWLRLSAGGTSWIWPSSCCLWWESPWRRSR